jgi:acetylornithine deacetylase/succinyl-diaminopimelate desuccinylase-like protein
VARGVEGTGATATVAFPAGRDHRVGGLPFETSPDEPFVRALVDAVRTVAPDRARVSGAPFWSEGSFLTALGIPCVYWAPGDISNCHTAEEHIRVDELLAAVRCLLVFMAGHCGAGSHGGGAPPCS